MKLWVYDFIMNLVLPCQLICDGLWKCRLKAEGIRCPEVGPLRLHVLVMEFIGILCLLWMNIYCDGHELINLIWSCQRKKMNLFGCWTPSMYFSGLRKKYFNIWWLEYFWPLYSITGKDGWAAPRLKDAALSLDKLREGYMEVCPNLCTKSLKVLILLILITWMRFPVQVQPIEMLIFWNLW